MCSLISGTLAAVKSASHVPKHRLGRAVLPSAGMQHAMLEPCFQNLFVLLHQGRVMMRTAVRTVRGRGKGELSKVSLAWTEAVWRAACKACVVQLLEALVLLHGQGVVHRALRPDNLLWYGLDGRWRLFGLARWARSGTDAPLIYHLRYTAPEASVRLASFLEWADIMRAAICMPTGVGACLASPAGHAAAHFTLWTTSPPLLLRQVSPDLSLHAQEVAPCQGAAGPAGKCRCASPGWTDRCQLHVSSWLCTSSCSRLQALKHV